MAATPFYRDRAQAGHELARFALQQHVSADVVLAIPRGGVVVAEPVAQALEAPLDVIMARKVGAPMQPELALGAVTRWGVDWNADVLEVLRIDPASLAAARQQAERELADREAAFAAVRPPLSIDDRTVIVVDDGLATGATLAVVVRAAQAAHAAAVTVAVPVAAPDGVARIERLGVRVLVLHTPWDFHAVGLYYEDFRPVTTAECLAILKRAAAGPASRRA